MILINLLETEKPTKKPVVFSYSILLLIIIVIELAGFAGVFFYQHAKLSELSARRNSLNKVAAIVKRFNNQIKVINRKTKSIKLLRAMRYSDISFMNRLGNASVPDVWLTYLSKDKTVTIAGKAFSYASVARYMISLSKVGKFKEINFQGRGLARSGGTPENPIVSFRIRFR